MTNNPLSDNLEEILAGYVLGDLDEAELIWLNEQLAANPQLQEKVAQLESTLILLPYGLPENMPQHDLRSQILAQAKFKTKSSKFRWSGIFSAVTAVAALWLGINNYSLRQQIASRNNHLQQQQELIALLRQPNNRLVALQSNNNVVNASGSLFISPESNTAILTLRNLKPLTGQQVYRLWAVSQDKKTGCANFTPNSEGTVHLKLSNDDAFLEANSVLITIEPKANTDQPLGSKFLTGSYSAI